MRTLELMRVLSDREIGKVEAIIKAQKRQSLQQIYALLKKYRKREGVPANDEIYQHAFGKEYSSSKNYLLRHELRLLNELIYDYLIEDTFTDYIKKYRTTYHVWLAQAFLKRKLNNVFASDVSRFIEQAKENTRPEDTVRLLDLQNLWMVMNGEKTIGDIERQMEFTESLKQEQIRNFRYRHREVEARQAFLKAFKMEVAGTKYSGPDDYRTPPERIIDIGIGNDDDLFEKALILKKYAYQTTGLAHIEILRQIVAINDVQHFDDAQRTFENQLALLNNIAVEYIALGQFAKADECLVSCIERCQKIGQPIKSWIIQNYIANQINQGRYQNGIDIFNRLIGELDKSYEYFLVPLYKAYCHLFINQPDEALRVLPEDASLNDRQHLLFRMIFLVAFILRGQFELATNECHNIARMINANEGPHYKNYELINNLFAKYLKVMPPHGKKRKESIQSLKGEMQRDEQRLTQLAITEFSLKWLIEAITSIS